MIHILQQAISSPRLLLQLRWILPANTKQAKELEAPSAPPKPLKHFTRPSTTFDEVQHEQLPMRDSVLCIVASQSARALPAVRKECTHSWEAEAQADRDEAIRSAAGAFALHAHSCQLASVRDKAVPRGSVCMFNGRSG